ncbi:hypothetical protein EB118_19960 [bacterium]|nr:hypothetical protein [bacterium]
MPALKCITIYFDEYRDKTKIKFSKAFEQEHWVLKADVLQDAIYDLEELYGNVLIEAKRKEIND